MGDTAVWAFLILGNIWLAKGDARVGGLYVFMAALIFVAQIYARIAA